MKQIIEEYGQVIVALVATVLVIGMVFVVFTDSFKDGINEVMTKLYGKSLSEDNSVSYELSDREFSKVVNHDIDMHILNDEIIANKSYELNEIFGGVDNISYIRSSSPKDVIFEDGKLTFLKEGITEILVEGMNDSGESAYLWFAVGVNG